MAIQFPSHNPDTKLTTTKSLMLHFLPRGMSNRPVMFTDLTTTSSINLFIMLQTSACAIEEQLRSAIGEQFNRWL